jgi:tetratricopeptide (TPR) repeat protein
MFVIQRRAQKNRKHSKKSIILTCVSTVHASANLLPIRPANPSEPRFLATRNLAILFFFAICSLLLAGAPNATAQTLVLPPTATRAMQKIYGGDTQGSVALVKTLQAAQPENPLGFLLEAEAQWWRIYCANSSVKYGMIDAWKRGKKAEDDSYLALADKVIELSRIQFEKSNSAEMHVYAGMGYALKTRMFAVQGENRAVARAGVAARAEFLLALEIDPQNADATAGLGLYNYYVDSLSSAVKILRFFMGIPGGDRKEGIRQMQVGIDRGVLTPVEMRFYLAKNLRNFDLEYEKALTVAEPLSARYPANSVFQLLVGNLNVELGRTEEAGRHFRVALGLPSPDEDCALCAHCGARVHEIARAFLESRH